MINKKLVTSWSTKLNLMVPVGSYRALFAVLTVLLVWACGEKKKTPAKAAAPMCEEDEEGGTTKSTNKSSKKPAADEEAEEEVEEEEEPAPKKTTKSAAATSKAKLAFRLQGTGTATGTATATKTATSTGTSTGTGTTTSGVTFEKDIKPFWTASCVTGCHTANGSKPPLDTWANVNLHKVDSVESTKAGTKLMPMPIGKTLTAAQKQLLVDWAAGGYLQGTPAGGGTSTDKDPPAEEEEEEEEEEEPTPKTTAKSKNTKDAEVCTPVKATATSKTTKAATSTKKKTTAKDEVEE